MIVWPDNTHPARLTARLGVSEAPAAAAVAVLAALQYVFLAQLWRGYPLKWAGDLIHMNVVVTGLLLSITGSVAIFAASVLRWRRGVAAARRLEVEASTTTFDGIRNALAWLSQRSTLTEPPQLRYTPKNASALEVREADKNAKRGVVVGLGQRKRQASDPDAFAAQLGHEVSHLELAATAVETRARSLVVVHFRVLGWLLFVFLLVVAFIDPRGLGSAPRAWGFVAVWNPTVYLHMSYQSVVLALSSLIVFVYSYYFVVRREHLHDFRGSQLVGSSVLADRVFAAKASYASRASAVVDFLQLHPTVSARRRVIRTRDLILLSVALYPFIVAGAQPLSMLLLTGWQDVLGLEDHWWNLAVTVAAGVILYLVLCADMVRLGLGALLHRRFLLKVPVYAALAGAATQVSRIIFEFVFGLRKGFPLDVIVDRIWTGVVSGGGKIALMVALVLLAVAYLAAICIAATGEQRAGRHSAVFHVVGGAATVGAFCAASLTSLEFIVEVLVLVMIAVSASIAYIAMKNHCIACGRRRFNATLLRTTCACGCEHLPLLRRWTEQPYAQHLPNPPDPFEEGLKSPVT